MRANKNGVNKDQKDKVKKDGYNRGQHCVYCLTYHIKALEDWQEDHGKDETVQELINKLDAMSMNW